MDSIFYQVKYFLRSELLLKLFRINDDCMNRLYIAGLSIPIHEEMLWHFAGDVRDDKNV